MKLTTKQLRRLIREEYLHFLTEDNRERGSWRKLSDEVTLKSDAADAYWDLENLLKKIEGGIFGSTGLRMALAKFAVGRYLNNYSDESAARNRIERGLTGKEKTKYDAAMNMLHALEVLIDEQKEWDERVQRG